MSTPWGVIAIIAFVAALLGVSFAVSMQWRALQAARDELRSRQNELMRASRMVMMGELSVWIAHEINQPLGAILANTAAAELLLAQRQLPLGELRDVLADILTDIRTDDLRAHDVIRSLRGLLEEQDVAASELDLHHTLAESARVLAADARRRQVQFVFLPRATNCCVLGDKVQLQQVMINLLINAMDAMQQTPVAARTVEIETADRDDCVEVQVRDRGHGFGALDGEALFASFFTTKQGGMGMGLSIARTIVQAHHGSIAAMPRAGGGAVFVVQLPPTVCGASSAEAKAASERMPSSTMALG